VSWRGTLLLAVAAAALGAWVYFGEVGGEARKQAADEASHRIFSVEPAAVSALELTLPDQATARVIRVDANHWQLESPVAYPADEETLERALHALSKLSSTGAIDPAPADLEPFGLGPSRRAVRVFSGAGAPQELFVGGATPVGGGKYVQLASDSKKLYTVAATDLSGLTPGLLELRDKRVLRADASAADDVTLRAAGKLLVHAKKSGADWQLLEPETAPADGERLRRALDELAMARASDFSDAAAKPSDYGFDAPEVELTLHTPAGEERLALARANGKSWARRGDDPVLLQVNERVLTSVPRTFFDYRAKRVLTLSAQAVKALELVFPRTNVTHRFELENDDWKPVEANLELRPLKLEDLLYAISALDASALEPANADRKALGLDTPVVTLRALDEKNAVVGELSLGDASPDRGIPAISSQTSEVWRLSNNLGREVPLSPEAFANTFVKKPGESAEPEPEPASEER
jgi:hypothetical protein